MRTAALLLKVGPHASNQRFFLVCAMPPLAAAAAAEAPSFARSFARSSDQYVRVFRLEATYPMDALLERVTASGVTVHEMDGKFVLKGRKRQTVSHPGYSGSLSQASSPKLGASPVGPIGGLPSSAPS